MPALSSWLQRRGFPLRLLLCFLGGALGALALPPFSWTVLFFPGFMATVFYLRAAGTARDGFALAFFYALGFHLAGLYWISASLFVDIARYIWVLPFSLAGLPMWLAFLFALGALAAHPLRVRPLAHALLLTLTLSASEILRGFLFTGFPWNLFGTVWIHTPLEQSVALFGIYGLTFLTLLAACLASLLLSGPSRAAWLAMAGCGALLLALAGWGAARLDTPPLPVVPDIRLRIVQPDIAQSERRTFRQRMAGLRRAMAMTEENGAGPVTAILWPETLVPDFLTARADLRRELARLVPEGGSLLTGTPALFRDGPRLHYANALAVLNGEGAITGLYEKHHLVPFGEFVPFKKWLKTVPVAADVIGARADFSPGPGARTLRAAGLPSFSPLICYEAVFSGGVLDNSDPPQLLVQITNDAWFGDTTGPYQHFEQARLRAIEEGLPLARAANTGISAVIDPLGRVTARIPLEQTGVIDAGIPRPLPQPLFRWLTNQILFALAVFFT